MQLQLHSYCHCLVKYRSVFWTTVWVFLITFKKNTEWETGIIKLQFCILFLRIYSFWFEQYMEWAKSCSASQRYSTRAHFAPECFLGSRFLCKIKKWACVIPVNPNPEYDFPASVHKQDIQTEGRRQVLNAVELATSALSDPTLYWQSGSLCYGSSSCQKWPCSIIKDHIAA